MTSDALKRSNRYQKTDYAIIGAGGIRIFFTSGLYEPQVAEEMAVNRAKALGCSLYSRNADGKIIQLYPTVVVVERKKRVPVNIHPEMLNIGEYIPGVQMLT